MEIIEVNGFLVNFNPITGFYSVHIQQEINGEFIDLLRVKSKDLKIVKASIKQYNNSIKEL